MNELFAFHENDKKPLQFNCKPFFQSIWCCIQLCNRYRILIFHPYHWLTYFNQVSTVHKFPLPETNESTRKLNGEIGR